MDTTFDIEEEMRKYRCPMCHTDFITREIEINGNNYKLCPMCYDYMMSALIFLTVQANIDIKFKAV